MSTIAASSSSTRADHDRNSGGRGSGSLFQRAPPCRTGLQSGAGGRFRSRNSAAQVLPIVAGITIALFCASPAKADLRLCNQTASKVGISLGYRDPQGWVTEGWWDLAPKACETLLKGALAARFYYVFAVDYTRGGEWSGRSLMCTRDSEFTIRGIEDCLARGYDRNGFFEVDTGEQKSWTIQLTDPNRADAPAKP